MSEGKAPAAPLRGSQGRVPALAAAGFAADVTVTAAVDVDLVVPVLHADEFRYGRD